MKQKMNETKHNFVNNNYLSNVLFYFIFKGLPDKRLYPSVSAVYGNTEVSMVYLGPPLDGWKSLDSVYNKLKKSKNLKSTKFVQIFTFQGGKESAVQQCKFEQSKHNITVSQSQQNHIKSFFLGWKKIPSQKYGLKVLEEI